MSNCQKVRAKAKVRCINPVNHAFAYPGDEFTFLVGSGKNCNVKKMPTHWEEIDLEAKEQPDSGTEVETLLEAQIKSMTAGRISQYILAYYGVKIDVGQAQETAYRQAMDIIRDPRHKRKPTSQILAGLNAMNDTPARKEEEQPAELPEGGAKAVVPGKDKTEEDPDDIEKPFKDLSMDELDAIERDEIIAKVKRLYGVEMANAGNKTVVLRKAMEIEDSALEVAE